MADNIEVMFTIPGQNSSWNVSDDGTPYSKLLNKLQNLATLDQAEEDPAQAPVYVCMYTIGAWGGDELLSVLTEIVERRPVVLLYDSKKMDDAFNTKGKTKKTGQKIKKLKKLLRNLVKQPKARVCYWTNDSDNRASMHLKLAACAEPPFLWMGSANATLAADKNNQEGAILLQGPVALAPATDSIANVERMIAGDEVSTFASEEDELADAMQKLTLRK